MISLFALILKVKKKTIPVTYLSHVNKDIISTGFAFVRYTIVVFPS